MDRPELLWELSKLHRAAPIGDSQPIVVLAAWVTVPRCLRYHGDVTRAILLFLAVCILWGTPYFFIKLALHDLAPAVVAFVRVAIGAVVLLPLLGRGGVLRGLRARLPWLAVLGLIEVVIPFLLIAHGERHITSSLAGILVAAEPLVVAVLAIWVDHSERVSPQRGLGLLLGFAGVVILLGLNLGHGQALLGAVQVLLATVCYGVGALIVKRRFGDLPPLGVVSVSLGISAVLLGLVALPDWPRHLPSGSTLLALAVLGVPCTGLAYVLFFDLIGLVGAARATVITYLTPLVAVALGVLAGGDTFGMSQALGLVTIITGAVLATLPRRITRARAETA